MVSGSFVVALAILLGGFPLSAYAHEADSTGGEPLAAAAFLNVQSDNYLPANARELTLGQSVEGEFSDVQGSTSEYAFGASQKLAHHWYKFKTTGNTASYKIRLESLDGNYSSILLYDADMKKKSLYDLGDAFTASSFAKTVGGLDKNAWYYLEVYAGYNAYIGQSGGKRYTKYRLTVEERPSIVDASVIIPTQIYTGSALAPSATVTFGGKTLVQDTDYKITYSNNTKIGIATAKIEGIGSYSGSKNVEFSIVARQDSPYKSDLQSYSNAAKKAGFRDLNTRAWYMDASQGTFSGTSVLYLDYTIGRGLMSGYSASTFGPSDSLSRAMAATIIYRTATGKTAANTNNAVSTGFSDAPANQWYSAAIAWCASNGVVTGYSGKGTFGPNDLVTREQLATMIYRYCVKYENQPDMSTSIYQFTDYRNISGWARDGIRYCVASGVMSGYSGSKAFGPGDTADRSQMSKIIAVVARMME